MTLLFDPSNPFPSLYGLTVSYAEQKLHAELADLHFGFNIHEVEAALLESARANPELKKERWIGLDPASLQTPYTEIRALLECVSIKPGQMVVDLGAAYGRMGLVMQKLYPESFFIGVEVAELRTREGNRIFQAENATHAKLITGDASSQAFELPKADIYFVYDLSIIQTIRKVIDRLKEESRSRPICVVGRGRATRDQIERHEPWLTEIVKPEFYQNFTIYRSAEP